MIRENIVKMFYDGENVGISEKCFDEEYIINRPLYTFEPIICNEILNDKELGVINIPKLHLISVLCYEHEIDSMKEDIVMEYNSIREKLRETVKNNI